MTNSMVMALAESTGYYQAWDTIQAAKDNSRYLENIELHHYQAREAELRGEDLTAFAKALGFDDLRHMFVSVKDQALEDLELRSFDWK